MYTVTYYIKLQVIHVSIMIEKLTITKESPIFQQPWC